MRFLVCSGNEMVLSIFHDSIELSRVSTKGFDTNFRIDYATYILNAQSRMRAAPVSSAKMSRT